jgi:hypothetical protein
LLGYVRDQDATHAKKHGKIGQKVAFFGVIRMNKKFDEMKRLIAMV